MFKTPTNINQQFGMTTRSMAQAVNLERSISSNNLLNRTALQPIQRGNIIGTAMPLRNPSVASLDLARGSLRLNSRSSSTQSLLGSTQRLDAPHPYLGNLGRGLGSRYATESNLTEMRELKPVVPYNTVATKLKF
jgi:hypothetical protein